MKKEDIESFLDKLPFRIITKDKSFYTVKVIRKLTDSSISFMDKFDGLNIVGLEDISQIKEINKNHLEKKRWTKMYGQCKIYGTKGLISRLLGFLARLNRKGYLCLNMSRELSKDLKRRGLTIWHKNTWLTRR